MDVYSLASEDTQIHTGSSKSLCGPCPAYPEKCHCKNDGFYIKQDPETGLWAFGCRGCYEPSEMMSNGKKRGMGDTIAYLRHFRGKSFAEAKAIADGQDEASAVMLPQKKQDVRETDEWQAIRHAALEDCIQRLWSADDIRGLEYARSRGWNDEIIKQFKLGYSLKAGIPRLIIPSINNGRYVAFYKRSMQRDIEPRWMVDGGMDDLYLADLLDIRKDLPIILCEDAPSAISIWQECSDIVNPIATGAAQCGQLVRWIARLACTPRVLIALDADTEGDKHSISWLKTLSNAKRLRPLLKDPNDMHVAGYSLREWISQALIPDQECCTVCMRDSNESEEVFSYDDEGNLYCSYHWQVKNGTVPIADTVIVPFYQGDGYSVIDGIKVYDQGRAPTLADVAREMVRDEEEQYKATLVANRAASLARR